jgi:hypothetical protein
MAITKQDSIFPDIHLAGGISTKATEYKELAMKGDNWESPIFKLGSAPTSTDIASAPTVTRKDHPVTDGGVRGPQNIGNTSTTNQLNDPLAQNQGLASGNQGLSNGALPPAVAPNSAFGNQVDHAFGKDDSQAAAALNGRTNGTTLGSNNPVYTGSA